VVGQAGEHGRERAARLAGAHQVAEERREDARARGERVGERLALAEARPGHGEPAHERGMLALLGDGGERLRDRHAGPGQRRELAGRGGELLGAEAASRPPRARRLLAQLGRVDAAGPELLPGGTRALGADDAAAGPAAARQRAVREDRHQPSSCVTRRTSATVVTPARAFAQPSSRSVAMPAAVAWRRT